MSKMVFVFIIAIIFSGSLWAGEIQRLYILEAGTMGGNYSDFVDQAPSRKITVPIPALLIEHTEGWILYDTGFGLNYDAFLNQFPHNILRHLTQVQTSRESAIATQIQAIGLTPNDIQWIVVSHLHHDHAGGLQDFPQAKIVVTKKEWDEGHQGRFFSRLFRGYIGEQYYAVQNRLQLIHMEALDPDEGFPHVYDFFQDGSLKLLDTSGHTAGHLSLLITLPSGTKMLAVGDAAYTVENYRQLKRPGWRIRAFIKQDPPKQRAVYKRLRAYEDAHPETLMFVGHDPDLWSQWKKFPDPYQ
jgi:N-acyl homoserine lactone hydrolase